MTEKNILIIEDEFPMRYLIEYQLKHNGFQVNLARDGKEGLEAIAALKPDIVLLDIMMPGMDGFEVCTRIKKNPETADIPVIFVTASGLPEYKARAFEVGAAEYVTKPFRPSELMAYIDEALKRSSIHADVTEIPPIPETAVEPEKGHILTFFSPKGGVGTTTLAVQLAETYVHHENQQVILIDLDLPFGGIAASLHLFPRHDILELLNIPQEYITMSIVDEFALRCRDNLFLIPAPGRLLSKEIEYKINNLARIFDILTNGGFHVLVDLGKQITPFTKAAMSKADANFVITSGQPDANKLVEQFLESTDQLGLESNRVMPVINEAYGKTEEVVLSRLPVARIPYNKTPSDTKLWLKEQGLQKLVLLLK